MDVMSIKLARIVRFDPLLSLAEKIERLEGIAEALAEASQKQDLEFFCIGEHTVYSLLAGMLHSDNVSVETVIRIREKQFAATQKVMTLAKTDEILMEQVKTTYKTDDLLAWELDRLLNSPHPQLATLRGDAKYMEMLSGWKNFVQKS